MAAWPAFAQPTDSPSRQLEGKVEVMFPVAAPGEQPPKPESGWRIAYTIYPIVDFTGGNEIARNPYGGSRAWRFTRVEFMRGYKDEAKTEPDWITILDDLVLTDMHVPYNDVETSHNEYWDISSQSFGFVKADASYLPTIGCYSCTIEPDGFTVREVVSDGIQWTSTIGQEGVPGSEGDSQNEKLRRGQVLWLWTILGAGNYRYVVKYGFTDDGTIRARVGGTAHNLRNDPVADDHGHLVHDNPATHLHTGFWRMQFNLGSPERNEINVVERITSPTDRPGAPKKQGAKLRHRQFNNGYEGGEIWRPYQFTSVMVESTVTKNRHDKPMPVAYMLMPMGGGIGRSQHLYTQRDFWITRVAPDNPKRRWPRGSVRYEGKYIELPDRIKLSRPTTLPSWLKDEPFVGEKTAGKAVVLWHQAGLQHIPRTEDFGAEGYDAYAGTALIHWAGFDLMPHNLWHKTPFYDLPPPPDWGGGGEGP
jgi:hypothetical protein